MSLKAFLNQPHRQYLFPLAILLVLFILAVPEPFPSRIPARRVIPVTDGSTLPSSTPNPDCPGPGLTAAELANCGAHTYHCIGRSVTSAWTFPGGSRELDELVNRVFRFDEGSLILENGSVGERYSENNYRLENAAGFLYLYTFSEKGYKWRAGRVNGLEPCNDEPDNLCIFQVCELESFKTNDL